MAEVTATATSAPKPAASAGLYTVPLGSSDTLKKGVAKLQFQVSSPIMKRAAAYVFNSLGFWDRFARPAVEAALKAKGITNLRLPAANFYANSAGNLKAPPLAIVPKGYKYYSRKGYDPKTGIAYLWVVVS